MARPPVKPMRPSMVMILRCVRSLTFAMERSLFGLYNLELHPGRFHVLVQPAEAFAHRVHQHAHLDAFPCFRAQGLHKGLRPSGPGQK